MQDLIIVYSRTRSYLRAHRTLTAARADRQLLGEMITSTEYALEWMRSGRMPGNRRGVERRSAYQRELLTDPYKLQFLAESIRPETPSELSDTQKSRLEYVLCTLSERERDCYVMAYGEGFSLSDIAEQLDLSKGTVSTYVKRAQAKIAQQLLNAEFS